MVTLPLRMQAQGSSKLNLIILLYMPIYVYFFILLSNIPSTSYSQLYQVKGYRILLGSWYVLSLTSYSVLELALSI